MQFHNSEELRTVRWGANAVLEGLASARSRHPGVPVWFVGDLPMPEGCEGVHHASSLDEALAGEAPRVYLCVFQSDDALLRVLRRIVERPNSWYEAPNAQAPVARYYHRNDAAHRVLLSEAAVEKRMFELGDLEGLLQALESTRSVEGSYVEVGVYQGRSARCAIRYMREAGIDRRSFLLDLYDGFSYEEAAESPDAFWKGTHTDTSIEGVRSFVGDCSGGLERVDVLRNNIISDPLPEGLGPIAVANIDVDMCEAVEAALFRLAPLISVGGMMIVEDAGHTPRLAGALLALDRFVRSEPGRGFRSVYMASGQTYLIRLGN